MSSGQAAANVSAATLPTESFQGPSFGGVTLLCGVSPFRPLSARPWPGRSTKKCKLLVEKTPSKLGKEEDQDKGLKRKR